MNNLKVFNTVLLLINTVCLVVLAVTFIFWTKGNAPTGTTSDEITVTTSALQFKTPYCTVELPSKWKDNIKFAGKEVGESYVGSFSCVMNGQEYPLYELYFGAPETGSPIGHILKDGKTVSFTVKSADFIPDAAWADEDRLLYMAMANSINDAIESVSASTNYVG